MNRGAVNTPRIVDGIYVNLATTIKFNLNSGVVNAIRVNNPTEPISNSMHSNIIHVMQKETEFEIDVNFSPEQFIEFLNTEIDRHPNAHEVLIMLTKFICEKLEDMYDYDEHQIPYDRDIIRPTIITLANKLRNHDIIEIIRILEKIGFDRT
jgi:hypothetical protein